MVITIVFNKKRDYQFRPVFLIVDFFFLEGITLLKFLRTDAIIRAEFH